MKYLVFPATMIIVLGIGMIIYAIIIAIKVKSAYKRKILKDEDLRKKVGRLVPVNLAGLFLSTFGIIILFVVRILG